MRAVWKFSFGIEDNFDLLMPKGAQLLRVDVQNDTPCIWAVVDPSAERVHRHFRMAGTGHEMTDFSTGWLFVGTFFMRLETLVFHLWDLGEVAS